MTLSAFSQTDTSKVYSFRTFENYRDVLQLSMGQNLTLGKYGRGEQPFKDAFATTYHFRQFSINAKYSSYIKKRLGWNIGVEFFKNILDFEKFADVYLENTGDSASISLIDYEHISVFGGVNYNLVLKNLMITSDFGIGVLHTAKFNKGEGAVIQVRDFTPNGINGYRGGIMTRDNALTPLLYLGLDLRYYLGQEYYIVASGHYTHSFMNVNFSERVSFREQRPYLETNIPINNISLTLGLGTIIN